jgi:murein DD-endopeptidase MepM/ murein hydrolase activator NlpD
MSARTAFPHHVPAEPVRRPAKAAGPKSAAAMSHHLQHKRRGNGYTLAHGGRQVRIGPVAFWIVVGTLTVMGVWSVATGTYFAFREDVLTRLIGRQTDMQNAYEDRIAELRAQVDRITSRQLLDQDQYEQKLDALLKRQSALERRTSALTDDLGVTGSVGAIKAAREPIPAKPEKLKASPISDTVIFVAPPDREARLESRELPASVKSATLAGDGAGLDGTLSRIAFSLDQVEKRQNLVLADMEERYDSKARGMRSVLGDLGVSLLRVPRGAVGGPYVPLKAPRANASNFDHQLYRINVARAEVDRLTRSLSVVPVRKPLPGQLEFSSPFGVRSDPFLGKPAMHTGVDLRGEYGEPVHATADGKVTHAGWDGGYGKMVEIDHGNGLATRYGHLSEIDVKVGQQVRIGQVVGKIGSTGRSTGPHLHYETRINNEAVDPQRFLRAGLRLGST